MEKYKKIFPDLMSNDCVGCNSDHESGYFCFDCRQYVDAVDKARAAIEKAEGKEARG